MTLSRPRASLRLLFVVALVALSASLATTSAPAAQAAPEHSSRALATTGSAKTVTAPWHPFNPLGHYDADNQHWIGSEETSKTPSVTVDRTTNLSDEVVNVSWRNFTPSSSNGSYADDQGDIGPAPFRTDGDTGSFYSVEVYECRGTNPSINPILNGLNAYKDKVQCYDASVFSPTDGDYGQNNHISTVTQRDGTGQVSLHVENRLTNDLLRCSPTQPCSVVVVPNQGGISNGSDLTGCSDHSQDVAYGPNYDQAQTADSNFAHALSDCSWSKRITVPITFAPLAGSCPNLASSFSASGSPPLRRGLNQLLAGWCRGSRPVSFDYDFSTSESAARTRFLSSSSTGLSSDTDVALTSEPADPSLVGRRPFVYAPIANDAVSIPYEIDNVKTGRPITDLRLSARLVAKLLTQSYAPTFWNCPALEEEQPGTQAPWCAKDIRNNPLSIFDDKEFQELNFRGDHPDRSSFPSTGVTTGSQQGVGSFFPTVAGGDSDLTYLLTKWIASDGPANQFLRGAKDGVNNDNGGMRINPNYRVNGGVLYPITSFTALDPGYVAPNIPYGGNRDHSLDLRTKQGFQGSWNPVGSPSQVIANLSRNRSTATNVDGLCNIGGQIYCNDYKAQNTLTVNFPRSSPEPNGVRDLTAVTDNTDAQSFGLPTAQLLTSAGDYVSPSDTSLTKAFSALRTNADGVTQSVDFNSLPDGAYPLLMPVYAMVPTCGISSAKANGIRGMLTRVTQSQTYGDAPGTLTRGLLKLSTAQLAATKRAVKLVSSKSCSTPSKGADATSSSGGHGGAGAGNAGAQPVARPSQAPSSPPVSQSAPSSTPSSAPRAQEVGYRSSDDGGSLALLPILLLLGGLLLIGGPLAWWGAGTGPGQVAVTKAKHLARESATDLRSLLPKRWPW